MKKILTIITLAITSFGALYAYNFTVNNRSSYAITVYNGATGFTDTVNAQTSKTVTLSDNLNYQLYYKAPWGSGTVTDYLAAISRDGSSGYMSLTLQQPAQPAIWYAKQVTIGYTDFGETELKHWPDAPYLANCDNKDWGTICSAKSDQAGIQFSN